MPGPGHLTDTVLDEESRHGANKGFRSPSVAPSWHTDPGVDDTSEVVIDPGDYFELTMEELREVARFAVQSAEEVLGMFEEAKPDDPRPRAAVGAAWAFVNGAGRTNLQRATAMDAHRAAKEAPSAAAKHAAHAAGDAAAAAYLHPFAKADQVGHILRSSAHAARAAELLAGGDPLAGPELVGRAATRATPGLVDVLRRYPPAPTGKSRVAVLMSLLDDTLRRR